MSATFSECYMQWCKCSSWTPASFHDEDFYSWQSLWNMTVTSLFHSAFFLPRCSNCCVCWMLVRVGNVTLQDIAQSGSQGSLCSHFALCYSVQIKAGAHVQEKKTRFQSRKSGFEKPPYPPDTPGFQIKNPRSDQALSLYKNSKSWL